MDSFICTISIKNDDNNDPIGIIDGFDEQIRFDPLSVLPELRCQQNMIDIDNFDFDDWSYENEFAFGLPLKLNDQERRQYVAVVKGIKKLIKMSYDTQNSISMSDYEMLASYFDISTHFTAVTQTCMIKNLVSKNNNHKSFFHYSSFSFDRIFDESTDYYEFFYECYCLSDIPFSILHYLLMNNYRFKQCDHCGRLFAAKNFKHKYCARNSQYPGFESYKCAEAVKRIRQDLQRNHIAIKKNLDQNYSKQQFIEFDNEFIKAFENMKKKSDYDNITRCYKTIDKTRWYIKIEDEE